MRLNGRPAIMRYLGRSPHNRDAWRKIRVRYGAVIRCFVGSGHVWARSEDLDAVDMQNSEPMLSMLAKRAAKREAVGEDVGGYPRKSHEWTEFFKRLQR